MQLIIDTRTAYLLSLLSHNLELTKAESYETKKKIRMPKKRQPTRIVIGRTNNDEHANQQRQSNKQRQPNKKSRVKTHSLEHSFHTTHMTHDQNDKRGKRKRLIPGKTANQLTQMYQLHSHIRAPYSRMEKNKTGLQHTLTSNEFPSHRRRDFDSIGTTVMLDNLLPPRRIPDHTQQQQNQAKEQNIRSQQENSTKR